MGGGRMSGEGRGGGAARDVNKAPPTHIAAPPTRPSIQTDTAHHHTSRPRTCALSASLSPLPLPPMLLRRRGLLLRLPPMLLPPPPNESTLMSSSSTPPLSSDAPKEAAEAGRGGRVDAEAVGAAAIVKVVCRVDVGASATFEAFWARGGRGWVVCVSCVDGGTPPAHAASPLRCVVSVA